MFQHITIILIAALLLTSGPSSADESRSCLPTRDVKIYDLFPNQPAEQLDNLPKPLKTTFGFGEDDGGTYKETTLEYAIYSLAIVRGVIDSITLISPEYKWYKGITIGMSRAKIRELLGSSLVAEGDNSDQYITCEAKADVYAILDFVDRKLTKITLIAERP